MSFIGLMIVLADLELKTGWLAIAGMLMIISGIDDDDHPNDNVRKK